MIKGVFFWLIACISIIAFVVAGYFFFFYDSDNGYLKNILEDAGFKDEDASGMESGPATPLPEGNRGADVSGSSGGSGSSSTSEVASGQTGSSGEGSSGEGNYSTMVFCTFEADKIIKGVVPCRCGLSAVCTEVGLICNALFNEGQGICESGN